MEWTPEELQSLVDDHPIVLFMKGTPNEPQCGFSNRAAQALAVPWRRIRIRECLQRCPRHSIHLCMV
jgi:glutaredoxin-related protein